MIVGGCGRTGNHVFVNDLLRISSRRANGIWPKDSPRYKSRTGRKFSVNAKIRKVKKHDYPWPDNIDPNISSGHLTYLSHFKPLPEKPKPVTLAFETPLVGLEKKIIEASCFRNLVKINLSCYIL